MTAPVLTLADQALANLIGFLAVQMIQDERTDMVLAALPELLPATSRNFGVVIELTGAGLELVACAPRRRDPRHASTWMAAQLRARAAVEAFLFWRGGAAMEALRAQIGGGHE